jgi:uncharacterized OsmC-like protein
MLGTFAGALAAREISPDEGRASCVTRGEVETEEGVLIIRRIHVHFTIRAGEEKRPVIERVHGIFAQKCPVFRTLQNSVQITSSFELQAG